MSARDDEVRNPVAELQRRARVLARLLDEHGLLRAWPTLFSHKLIALEHLAAHFEREERLTEAQLNARLNELHAFGDAAVLRRWMVEYGLFRRTRDGSAYWLESTEVPEGAVEPR